jgi:tripartite ATP-independent transporter DctP family solute receptor
MMGINTLFKRSNAVFIASFLCAVLLMPCLVRAQTAPKKVINATLANAHEPGNIIYRTHEEFARRVKEKTDGELLIKVVGSGQLGTGRAAMEAVQAGTIEFTHNPNSNLSPYEQSRFLFDLPFIFRDLDHMAKVMDGPIGKESVALVEKKLGLTIVMEGIFEGPRVTYNRVRPIEKPQDFQGLKIRVMENPINVATFRALGANPVPMAFTELYLALQQGTIDGAENAQVNILAAKHYEVAKFISRTNHLNAPIQVYANTRWLNSLSAEHKKTILEAGREAVLWERQQWSDAVNKAEEQLIKEGCKINSPDLAPFREAVKDVWKQYEERVGGWEKIQKVLDVK